MVKKVSDCKNIEEKDLVIVLDFVAVANLKLPNYCRTPFAYHDYFDSNCDKTLQRIM